MAYQMSLYSHFTEQSSLKKIPKATQNEDHASLFNKINFLLRKKSQIDVKYRRLEDVSKM